MRAAWLMLAVLVACGDDRAGTALADALAVDTLETSLADSAPLDTLETNLADSAPAAAETAPDTAADSEPATTADSEPATAPDSASPIDSDGPDATAAIDPATCPVPAMSETYPGPFPPFPYGAWTLAEGCVAHEHDVVIVLGCPSEDDGDPAPCQTERARITQDLYQAGWAKHFIVTGAAVHNSHVEADALHALLVQRGIPAAAILKEPLARHTDENLYYATRIMESQGWTSALVVSEDPGHLMMTALCDSNCCVDLGRLSLYEWEIEPGLNVKAGHYALIPPSVPNGDAECQHIGGLFMCVNLADRDACKDDFQLPP